MDGESRAGAQLAGHRDTPTMTLDHVFDDREPQTCPARGSGSSVVHSIEALEDSIQVTGGDPLTRVAYPKHRLFAHHLQLGPDRSSGRGVPDRIVEEIADGDGHVTPASRDLRWGYLKVDIDSVLVCDAPYPLQLLLHEVIEAQRVQLRFVPLQPRQIEQIGDQTIELTRRTLDLAREAHRRLVALAPLPAAKPLTRQ